MMDAFPMWVALFAIPDKVQELFLGQVDSTVVPNGRKPSNSSALKEKEKDNDLHF